MVAAAVEEQAVGTAKRAAREPVLGRKWTLSLERPMVVDDGCGLSSVWCWTQRREADELGIEDDVDVDGNVVHCSSQMQVCGAMENELMDDVDQV